MSVQGMLEALMGFVLIGSVCVGWVVLAYIFGPPILKGIKNLLGKHIE